MQILIRSYKVYLEVNVIVNEVVAKVFEKTARTKTNIIEWTIEIEIGTGSYFSIWVTNRCRESQAMGYTFNGKVARDSVVGLAFACILYYFKCNNFKCGLRIGFNAEKVVRLEVTF